MAIEKKLNEYQFNKLNLVENLEIRKSLISILSYLMIINDRKNAEYYEHQLYFLKKDLDKLKISFGKFHKLYIKNHKKLSLQTLKNRFETLIDLKLLIVVEKVKKTNVYQFVLEKPVDFTNDMPNDMSNIENYENKENINTAPENIVENSCYISLDYRITKDLDYNTSRKLNYTEYLESERKVCDWSIVCTKFTEICKALKVRSSWIKDKVTSKLEKYYHTITAKHLESYIVKMISNARTEYYKNYDNYVRNSSTASTSDKKLRFNNFEGRTYTNEQYKDIEEKASVSNGCTHTTGATELLKQYQNNGIEFQLQ